MMLAVEQYHIIVLVFHCDCVTTGWVNREMNEKQYQLIMLY